MVFLVHHGDALDAVVDAQRPLSAEGRAHAAALAASLSRRGVRPDVIWHSGKLRARQTAEAFRLGCNLSAEMAAIRGLQPSDPPDWIRDRLVGEHREVMLVGHFPYLPRLLALLTKSVAESGSGFPRHGVVALEASGMAWKECWREQ